MVRLNSDVSLELIRIYFQQIFIEQDSNRLSDLFRKDFNPIESIFSKSVSEPIQKTFRISFDANRFKIKWNQTDSIQAFIPNGFEVELKNCFGFFRTKFSDWAGFISNRLTSNKIQITLRIRSERNLIQVNPNYFLICVGTNPN